MNTYVDFKVILIKKCFFVLVKSYRRKKNKKFKTGLMTSFILLLTPVFETLFNKVGEAYY